jgi:protein transport protein SEC24
VVLVCPAGGNNTLVGVVTYDSSVHFYNVSKGQAVAQMLVMADTSDVYAPMSSSLLAKLSDAREQLAELLSSIPGMFAAAQGPEACGTAAIEVGMVLCTGTMKGPACTMSN